MSKFTKNVVILDRGNYTTCTVHLHGGTIVSFRVQNTEILYKKQRAVFDCIRPIRGGIKLAFPYFGRRLHGMNHGFARYVPWELESGPTTISNGNVEAIFSLKESEYTKSVWNFKFKLMYKLTLCVNRLLIDIKVENTSSHFPFSFNLLRHSIFKVENIRMVAISGLSKCQYFKFGTNIKNARDPDPDQDKIKINRAFLDVYLKAPSVVEVENIDSKGRKLRITSYDTASTDVVLYNPWMESDNIHEDSYHDTTEYLNFIGVGNGFVHTDIRLEPNQTWESQHSIEVIDEERDETIENLCRLLNNPWELFNDICTKVNTY